MQPLPKASCHWHTKYCSVDPAFPTHSVNRCHMTSLIPMLPHQGRLSLKICFYLHINSQTHDSRHLHPPTFANQTSTLARTLSTLPLNVAAHYLFFNLWWIHCPLFPHDCVSCFPRHNTTLTRINEWGICRTSMVCWPSVTHRKVD